LKKSIAIKIVSVFPPSIAIAIVIFFASIANNLDRHNVITSCETLTLHLSGIRRKPTT